MTANLSTRTWSSRRMRLRMFNYCAIASILGFGLLLQAQDAGAPSAPKGPSTLEALLPFAAMIAIFYFLVIRPQAQRQKAQQKLLSELKRGDDVVTSSGILGRIEGLTELYVTLEIADGVRIKMLRSQIAGTQKAQQAQQGKA
jgi:preprotein translocase subunit YajC